MPQEVIPILRVADAADAVAWYRLLGFEQDWEHRFAPDFPAFVSISRGLARLYLSEHEGDALPGALIYIRHANLDRVAEQLGVDIEEAPWGREIAVEDPDGNRLRMGDPSDE